MAPAQSNEVDYIAFEDSESDVEIDLSTAPPKKPVPKVPKHFRKSNAKVYDNISVYAPPDSNLIFRCSQKRANWYLSRDLARSLSPTSIHLNFAPAGQGHVNDPYYLEERENKCVICGQETAEVGATMLHVVPEQYRKWFPIKLKSHSSHDIVVACPECNAQWDREAAVVRKTIVGLYQIPLEGIGWIKDHEAGLAKSAAGAKAKVKKVNVIPRERMKVLETSVVDWWNNYFNARKDVTSKMLKEALDAQATYKAPDYKEHGQLVMAQSWREAKPLKDAPEGWRDVHQFIRSWRSEFLKRAKPKHLSPEWRIENPTK
ncbi:MAG: hypothetical protein JOS17DRAFT_716205 [Linnemannia elongata]|nr:MAG: hypothetical protein JOS17DRAFT_716205 [Linnemannia elongata]